MASTFNMYSTTCISSAIYNIIKIAINLIGINITKRTHFHSVTV